MKNSQFHLLKTLAGIPTAVQEAPISFLTKAPAPMIASLPTLTPCRRVAPAPIRAFAQILFSPHNFVPTATCAKSATSQS